jgi:hypothetical protein
VLRRHLAETERRLAELAQTRATLHDLLATAQATDPDLCTGSICTILDPPGPRT